jgi:magnesium transporter
VLIELNEEVRAELIGGMDAEELIAATEGMEVDDLADLIGDLPETLNQRVLRSMDAQDRERLNAVLAFEEDSAGGSDEPRHRDGASGRHARSGDALHAHPRRAAGAHRPLFVVNRHDKYLGGTRHHTLLTEDPETHRRRAHGRASRASRPKRPAREVAKLFEDRDLVSAPSSAGDGKLLGRITIDDVVDVIREEADHSVMSMAGLHEDEDLFAGVRTTARAGAIWLGINLATAVFAANVVGLFEATIEKVVALAVLMPIVASMGGIAGSSDAGADHPRPARSARSRQRNARWLLVREDPGGPVERRAAGPGWSASPRALVSQVDARS